MQKAQPLGLMCMIRCMTQSTYRVQDEVRHQFRLLKRDAPERHARVAAATVAAASRSMPHETPR